MGKYFWELWYLVALKKEKMFNNHSSSFETSSLGAGIKGCNVPVAWNSR